MLEAVTNLLGKRTAQMHLNLAGGAPAFEPERFSLLFQRSIQQSLRQSLRETQRAVRRNRAGLPADAEAMAVALLEHGDRLLAAFDTLRTRKLDAARIRVHGDLHLGQALWTGRDVVFIDFEGEPGRSIGERSIKRSPLADVAGMLRSFDYAGRVALATSAERGRTRATDDEFLERWRRTATSVMQDRFWSTYRTTLREGTTAAGSGARLIPADDADARLLLDAHIVLKALYEVRYELANRPGWVSWPLAAVVQMLPRHDHPSVWVHPSVSCGASPHEHSDARNTRMGSDVGAAAGGDAGRRGHALRGVGAAGRGRDRRARGAVGARCNRIRRPGRGSGSSTASGTATATASASTTATRCPTRHRAGSPTACSARRRSSTPPAGRGPTTAGHRRALEDAVLYELHVGTFTPAGHARRRHR